MQSTDQAESTDTDNSVNMANSANMAEDGKMDITPKNGETEDNHINALKNYQEHLNSEVVELQKALVKIKEQSNDRELQYDLLVQTTIKKDKDMTCLKNRILDLERRSMNKNVRINNLPERPRENPAKMVQSFLENKIPESEYDIEIAHRNGPKVESQGARARPMIVQLVKRGMVETLLKATRNEGEYNPAQIRVARQIPTELRHITAKLHHIADFARHCHPLADIQVRDKAIYINNQKRKPPLVPPTLERILTCDPDELDVISNVDFFASDLIGLKNSTFRAFVSPAANLEDARYAYLAIARFPRVSASSHLISAYYTQDEEYDYHDDGDHGLGRHVFDLMIEKGLKGVIIFLSRDFGGIHLGSDRFTIINRVVKQAMAKFNAAATRNPLIRNPDRLQFQKGDPAQKAQATIPTATATNLAEQSLRRLAVLQQGSGRNQTKQQDLEWNTVPKQSGPPGKGNKQKTPKENPAIHPSTVELTTAQLEAIQNSPNMHEFPKLSATVDQTKHKHSYNGPIINPLDPLKPLPLHGPPQGASASNSNKQNQLDHQPAAAFEFSAPPSKQLFSTAVSSQGGNQVSPVVLDTQREKGSLSLPTSSKGNDLQHLMITKPAKLGSRRSRNKGKNNNKGQRPNFPAGSVLNLDALVIRSPRLNATKQASAGSKPSPKRPRTDSDETEDIREPMVEDAVVIKE